MADAKTVHLSQVHTPKPASVEAFEKALPDIKNMFHKMRIDRAEHDPVMFSRVEGHTDHQLLEGVDVKKDLIQVRTGESA
jgi:hypothetical protein